jgi:FkbM family methyltransferase
MSLARRTVELLPEPIRIGIKKWHYARSLRSSQISDEPDLAVLPRIVRPEFVCLDLGANVGLFTKHLSIHTQEVTAVEPIAETFVYLQHSVRKLGLTNVTLVNAAVSDHDGTVAMEPAHWEDGRPNLYQAHVSSCSGNIRATTVDTLCRNFRTLDFIKCDVEGHEAAVVRGATETIARLKPIWLLETDRESEAFHILLQHGYKVNIAVGGELIPDDGSTRVNYWFLP